jgi:hypothetical protein
MLGPLPDGQAPTVLTQAFSSASFWLQESPQISAHLVSQSPDNASVQKVYNILKAYVGTFKQWTDNAPPGDPTQLRIDIVTGLIEESMTHVRLDGDKLVVDWDADQLGVVGCAVTRTILRGQAAVDRLAAEDHMKQITDSLRLYASTNHGSYPDSLEDLAKYFEKAGVSIGDLLSHPGQPDQKIGYGYVKPTQGDKTPADHVLLYEKYDAFGPGVSVGFFDGHIERVTDESKFKKLLEYAKGEGK